MKRKLFTALFTTLCVGLFAQTVTEKDLQEIQSGFKKDASTRAIQNILTND